MPRVYNTAVSGPGNYSEDLMDGRSGQWKSGVFTPWRERKDQLSQQWSSIQQHVWAINQTNTRDILILLTTAIWPLNDKLRSVQHCSIP
jgi:hypothetical protein